VFSGAGHDLRQHAGPCLQRLAVGLGVGSIKRASFAAPAVCTRSDNPLIGNAPKMARFAK
jgi:hypothetical protein